MNIKDKYDRNVLIVDDEEDFVSSLTGILESYEFKVRSAHDAVSALDMIEVFDAQVVLLDIRLGKDSGLDLIRLLKDSKPGLICIMMTAYSESDTVLGALKQGAYDYLTKPLSPPDLLMTLEQSFELVSSEREKKQLQNQLLQAQKMEALGTMAGGIAHDFNNILTIIMGRVELAIQKTQMKLVVGDSGVSISQPPSVQVGNIDKTILNDLLQVKKATCRATELVSQILVFSRQEQVVSETVDPSEVISESLALLRSIIPATVAINEDIDPSCGLIKADPTQLHQILMNLCGNSVHAMDENGELFVALNSIVLKPQDINHLVDKYPGNYVRLTVTDSGVGMSQAIIEKIFDPFFTTKTFGQGTGIGLAVVHGIVEKMGGIVNVYSQEGKGARFEIDFPAVEVSEFTQKDCDLSNFDFSGTERVLFVDDEEGIVQLSEEQLTQYGYSVVPKTDPNLALEMFYDAPDAFDIVVTDQSMPGLSGLELAEKIRKVRPRLPIVLCTGYSSKVTESKLEELNISECCSKPVSVVALAKTIRVVLDSLKVDTDTDA